MNSLDYIYIKNKKWLDYICISLTNLINLEISNNDNRVGLHINIKTSQKLMSINE